MEKGAEENAVSMEDLLVELEMLRNKEDLRVEVTMLRKKVDDITAECEKKCYDAHRKGYAMGYAFADKKWIPVYKTVCEKNKPLQLEVEMLSKTLAEQSVRIDEQRREIIGLRDRIAVSQMHHQLELDGRESMALSLATEEIQRLRKKTKKFDQDYALLVEERDDANLAEAVVRKERDDAVLAEAVVRDELVKLQKKQDILLDLVGPTLKLMESNPELFGGEARGSSSPRTPPAIHRMQPLKEKDNEMALNFLRSLVTPSRSCLLVESPSVILPGIAKTEASTEGLCMALTEVQYQEMVRNGEIKKPRCVLTGSNRCPCTPGGPGGCFPEPEPGAPYDFSDY
jgi:hypothetical protein